MGLAWQGAARGLFESCDQILVVNAKNFGHPGATQLEDLRAAQAAAHGPYHGILWRVRSALRPGLSVLKPLLHLGAPVLLVVEARRPPEALLRSLFGKPGWPPHGLEDVCEALLLKGFGEPMLHVASKAGFAVSAKNPAVPSQLDVFFEQPAD
jgi:hypothetical protein